jgi:bifunctional pyridoxal-dependent enzyme with beta-cystathionase and maltose regulon repressor activities
MICSWALPDSQLGMRKRETAYRYCGPNLANVLRFICNGSYHVDEHWKRNSGSIEMNKAQGKMQPKFIFIYSLFNDA